jgi:hypothetical protein
LTLTHERPGRSSKTLSWIVSSRSKTNDSDAPRSPHRISPGSLCSRQHKSHETIPIKISFNK